LTKIELPERGEREREPMRNNAPKMPAPFKFSQNNRGISISPSMEFMQKLLFLFPRTTGMS
jgi:hypothetical protein